MKISKVSRDGSIIYVCHSSFDEKKIPKTLGFVWNHVEKRWQTEHIQNAALLKKFADASLLAELEAVEVSPEDADRVAQVVQEVEKATQANPGRKPWLQRFEEVQRILSSTATASEDEELRLAVPVGSYILDVNGREQVFHVRVSKRTGLQYLTLGYQCEYIGHDRGYLRRLAKADLEAAGTRYGLATGQCWKCNRRLTDEISKLLGVGPECGEKQHAAYKATQTGSILTPVPSIDDVI